MTVRGLPQFRDLLVDSDGGPVPVGSGTLAWAATLMRPVRSSPLPCTDSGIPDFRGPSGVVTPQVRAIPKTATVTFGRSLDLPGHPGRFRHGDAISDVLGEVAGQLT